jgi:hypothetical protein
VITPELEDDYLTRHRAALLQALTDAHPVAALRALAVALNQSERGEDIAMWLHELLKYSSANGHEFVN